jgi:hypothetical protein
MSGACIGQVLLQQQPGNYQDKKLCLVGVQEVKWDKGGTVSVGVIIFSIEKATNIMKSILI